MAAIRFLTAGESHGPKLCAIIEGLGSGFIINIEEINADLKRRQQGFGRGGRMKIEKDEVLIRAGLVAGKTTGAPLALEIHNLDYKNWQEKDISPLSIPRPGHADFAGLLKYQHDDIRLSLERASARETAIRTAVGCLVKQILRDFNIEILGYLTGIGSISFDTSKIYHPEEYRKLAKQALNNEFAFAEPSLVASIEAEIHSAMKAKDTLGGVFENVALGLPIGLGSYVHFDRRLDANLAHAMMSIPAMKAVEIGTGIPNSKLRGTEVHDEFIINNNQALRTSNRAGGLEGGMTNGMPLVVRTYMKPISTTLNPRQSIDFKTHEAAETIYERSDFCAVQRAVVIGEAMMSFVLMNALTETIGGDNRANMHKAFELVNKSLA